MFLGFATWAFRGKKFRVLGFWGVQGFVGSGV